jgi:hypothetical protein
MNSDDVRQLLDRHPFEPFRIRLTSGDVYEVRDPHSVALMKNRLFLALPTDRSVLVPYLHIAALESVQAA